MPLKRIYRTFRNRAMINDECRKKKQINLQNLFLISLIFQC